MMTEADRSYLSTLLADMMVGRATVRLSEALKIGRAATTVAGDEWFEHDFLAAWFERDPKARERVRLMIAEGHV